MCTKALSFPANELTQSVSIDLEKIIDHEQVLENHQIDKTLLQDHNTNNNSSQIIVLDQSADIQQLSAVKLLSNYFF